MAQIYNPDSEFYKKQIKSIEKERQKLQDASYSSERRGYVIDGKLLSEADRTAQINKLNKSIKDLQADEKKFGVYGPNFGKGATSNEAGKQFLELYNAAAKIKVTSYDSSVENLEAWSKVKDFLDDNPDIRVVSTRSASVKSDKGYNVRQKIPVLVDPRKDPIWKRAITVNPPAAIKTATEWAEKDTVKTETVTKGKNPNTATTSKRRTVVDEDKLGARQVQIDSIVARQPVPQEITQASGSKVQPKPVVKTPVGQSPTAGTTPSGTTTKPMAPNRKRIGDVDTMPDTKTTSTPAVVPETPESPPAGGGTGGGTAPKTRQDFRNSFLSVVNKQGKTSWKTVNQYINAGKDAKQVAARQARWDAYVTKNSVPGGVKKDGPSDETKVNIQEEFGSLWDIYNEDAEVKKVIDLSVKEGWYNDPVKMEASLTNTNWFRTTQSSARKYMINQSTDPATAEATLNQRVEELRTSSLESGITLSDESLRRVGEQSLKFGWSPQQIANAVGSEAVATANRGGPTAVADLRKGTTGTRLREIADSYGIKVNDTMLDQYVANVIQGTSTEVQFTDLMKNQASTMYRSLAPQIEKGIDVKTATSMYTNTAASVLGVDPSTVDWTQDKWNKALNYQDPKTNEYRQMDSYEWNRYLRSLPEWQETDDAKSTYRRAAFTLAQAFGKTS